MIWGISRKTRYILFTALAMVSVLALTIVLLVIFTKTAETAHQQIRGAVVTNGHECAEIAAGILRKEGSSVMDAVVAAMLCEGIAMPQSTGLGGGFLMTIYSKSSGRVESLNAREVAPLAAYENMYGGNSSISSRGGLAVAVPGELKGLWAAHRKYGKLDWSLVVQPAIDLCFNGHLVTPFLDDFLKSQKAKLMKSPTLSEIYIDPTTNEPYKEGDRIYRKQLGRTLKIIAQEGASALYNGSLTETFVNDIKEMGGIITAEDLNLYEPEWSDPITAPLPNNDTLYTTPLPGSGPILAFILNILHDFLDAQNPESVRNYQRIVESFKYGYGKRTELGDKNFVDGVENLVANLTSPFYAAEIRALISDFVTFSDPEHYGANTSLVEDHGTAHIAILSPDGDAVSVTGTINLYFGAYFRSRSTGIILNDQMDDFSSPSIINSFDLPPSPANYIRPRKRPLSSMVPSIIVDSNGEAKLVIGGAGGSKITTSVALIVARHLWFDYPLKVAMDNKRIHHQLFPMSITAEEGFDDGILSKLSEIGHNYTIYDEGGFTAITAITRAKGTIEGSFDVRRTGSVVYL